MNEAVWASNDWSSVVRFGEDSFEMLNGVTLMPSGERMTLPVAMTSASDNNILLKAIIRKKGRIRGNAFLTDRCIGLR